jgi:hypothetical protein
MSAKNLFDFCKNKMESNEGAHSRPPTDLPSRKFEQDISADGESCALSRIPS